MFTIIVVNGGIRRHLQFSGSDGQARTSCGKVGRVRRAVRVSRPDMLAGVLTCGACRRGVWPHVAPGEP